LQHRYSFDNNASYICDVCLVQGSEVSVPVVTVALPLTRPWGSFSRVITHFTHTHTNTKKHPHSYTVTPSWQPRIHANYP